MFRLLLLISLTLHYIDKYIIKSRNWTELRRTIARTEDNIAQNRDQCRTESGDTILREHCSTGYQCDLCYEHKHTLRLHNNSPVTLLKCHQLLREFNAVRLVYGNLGDNHINAINQVLGTFYYCYRDLVGCKSLSNSASLRIKQDCRHSSLDKSIENCEAFP